MTKYFSKLNSTTLFFGLVAVLVLTVTAATIVKAAPRFVSEIESGTKVGSYTVVTDATASAGAALQFTAAVTPPAPTPGARPTAANTGPRYALTNITPDQFLSTRTCNRQRITGDLVMEGTAYFGQTFTLTDCEINGTFRLQLVGGEEYLTLAQMPIINMDYVDVTGGFAFSNAVKLTMDHSYIDSGSQISLHSNWIPFITAPAPYNILNSVFFGPYFTQPTHAEPFHAGGYGSGYRFTNVAFLQQSGSVNNSGVTATINFHGTDAVFDGCWFVFTGAEAPSYFTAYLDASNSIVRNSKFSAAPAGYIYPSSSFNPTFTNNTDVDTGAPVTFP